MDFADIGSEVTEAITAQAILKARQAVEVLRYTGSCHNIRCGDDLEEGLFCNIKCRDEYEKLRKLK